MPVQNQKKQIVEELRKTALGEAYHGKALRAAKKIFNLSREELEFIDAWETGASASDPFEHTMRLQDIAIRLGQELENNASVRLEADDVGQEDEPAGPGM